MLNSNTYMKSPRKTPLSKPCGQAKFSSRATPTTDTTRGDELLQCRNNRRRYLRRGSRSPTMMQDAAGHVQLATLSNELLHCPVPSRATSVPTVRRLSLMSALNLHMESAHISKPILKLACTAPATSFATPAATSSPSSTVESCCEPQGEIMGRRGTR
jgi:hypothetical protein